MHFYKSLRLSLKMQVRIPINELIALKVAISDENYSYFVDVSDEPTNDVLKAEVFEPIELHRRGSNIRY